MTHYTYLDRWHWRWVCNLRGRHSGSSRSGSYRCGSRLTLLLYTHSHLQDQKQDIPSLLHTLLADLMSTKVLYPQLNAYHVHWVVDTYNLMLILSCLFSYSIIFCYTSCSYNCSFIVNSGGRMGWGTKKSHFHFASKISFTVIVRLNVENLKKRSTCSFEDLHKYLTWNKIYLYIWGLGLYLPVHLTTWVMIYLCIWRWHEI